MKTKSANRNHNATEKHRGIKLALIAILLLWPVYATLQHHNLEQIQASAPDGGIYSGAHSVDNGELAR